MRNLYPLLFIIISSLFCLKTAAQTGIPVPTMSTADQEIQNFINTWNIPGGSFAIAKDGQLVYAKGFGYATLDSQELIQPHHQFRLASISKTFTTVGIMHLIEAGQLSLSDTIFGTNGILNNQAYYGPISDPRVYNITLRNLLEHSGGWDRSVSGDVVFRYNNVANYFGKPLPVSDTLIIKFALTLTLDFAPGTSFAYSNLGFMLLGKIIEQVSGMPYEQYIQQVVLEPVGAYSAQLGKSLREDKARQEVEYFGNPNDPLVPSVLGPSTPAMVPIPYGAFDMKSLGSAGTWISSAKDLLRFLSSVDREPTFPDQLEDSTIQMMTTPSSVSTFYGMGWIAGPGTWGHDGGLPGTATLYYRRQGGISWAALINARPADNTFYGSISSTMARAATATTWPTHDLFDVPDQAAASMSFGQITDTTIEVSIIPGDGFRRLLVVREEDLIHNVPHDGVAYPPSAILGNGQDLGLGEYVVANGNPSLVTVYGLQPGRTYHFEVFEWNQTAQGFPIYLTSKSITASEQTTGANAIDPVQDHINLTLYPNPVSDLAKVQLDNNWRGDIQFEVINALGQRLYMNRFSKNQQQVTQTLDLDDLPSGNYHLILRTEEEVTTQSFIKK